jgi:hypothetical protein
MEVDSNISHHTGLFAVTIQQALFIAPCSHAFHYKCLRPLLDNHYPAFVCPLCRTFADLEADVEVEHEEWEDVNAAVDADGKKDKAGTKADDPMTGAGAETEVEGTEASVSALGVDRGRPGVRRLVSGPARGDLGQLDEDDEDNRSLNGDISDDGRRGRDGHGDGDADEDAEMGMAESEADAMLDIAARGEAEQAELRERERQRELRGGVSADEPQVLSEGEDQDEGDGFMVPMDRDGMRSGSRSPFARAGTSSGSGRGHGQGFGHPMMGVESGSSEEVFAVVGQDGTLSNNKRTKR